MASEPKLDRRYDYVGPPDRISKIRPIRLRRVDGETEVEKNYRLSREELNRWNSAFWADHNQLFDKQKIEFMEKKKAELGRIEQVSAEDMSGFYKSFLNDRHAALMAYNKEWYRRNFQLLFPAIRVAMARFTRRLFR